MTGEWPPWSLSTAGGPGSSTVQNQREVRCPDGAVEPRPAEKPRGRACNYDEGLRLQRTLKKWGDAFSPTAGGMDPGLPVLKGTVTVFFKRRKHIYHLWPCKSISRTDDKIPFVALLVTVKSRKLIFPVVEGVQSTSALASVKNQISESIWWPRTILIIWRSWKKWSQKFMCDTLLWNA